LRLAAGLDIISPPAIRPPGLVVTLDKPIIDVVPRQQNSIEQEVQVASFFKRREIPPFAVARQQFIAGLKEEKPSLGIDSPGGSLGSQGEILQQRSNRFFSTDFQAGDRRGPSWSFHQLRNVLNVAVRGKTLREEQPDHVIRSDSRIPGLQMIIRIEAELFRRSKDLRLSAVGRAAESSGKNLIEFNGHAFQAKTDSRRNFRPPFFHSAQVPAIPRTGFKTDPIADLHLVSKVEGVRQNNLAAAASPLPVQFEPAGADRGERQKLRRALRIGTVMENAA
jgi:hypothetical protein